MAMAQFFTGEGDTYENAEDKDTWMKETTSGKYDWSAAPVVTEEEEDGVKEEEKEEESKKKWWEESETKWWGKEGGGGAEKRKVCGTGVGLTAEEAAVALHRAGALKRPDGSAYETDTGYKLAQQRVVEEAARAKRGV